MPHSSEPYARVEHVLPVQRGNVRIDTLTLLHAILYVAVNGDASRKLQAKYGRKNQVYTRTQRRPGPKLHRVNRGQGCSSVSP